MGRSDELIYVRWDYVSVASKALSVFPPFSVTICSVFALENTALSKHAPWRFRFGITCRRRIGGGFSPLRTEGK